MIYVRKPIKKAPKDFLEKADKELAEARKHFNRKRLLRRKFKFEAYGTRSLRDALNDIFGYRCAYCESFYGATQPVAIEHFRPKGKITDNGRDLRPGYWWLAAAWSNLLPSCTDCNSPRKKRLPDGTLQLSGKGNQFPLLNPAKRARSEGGERKEKPLLLDPCNGRIRPEKHLEFVLDDKQRVGVRAQLMSTGKASRIGTESIRVFALDRPELVKARQSTAKRFLLRIEDARNAYVKLKQQPRSSARRAEFDRRVAELRDYLGDEQPYLGMCRQLITEEFPQLQK
jgi:5-methylcytosine-specific restriction endonuclease McrA